MILRWSRRLLLIGLGAIAGAVLPSRLEGQVPTRRDTIPGRRDTLPTRVDTVRPRPVPPTRAPDTIRTPLPPRPDTLVGNDTSRKSVVPLPAQPVRDTVKPPLARAEAPPVLEIGAPRIYDRAALFATGAVMLSDLLGRVPGLTEFTTGGVLAPSFVASQGDARRVRIFLDGLELDPMDRRAQGLAPVNDLPLHALEELRIERGADEVRVYARSWRVERTTPYTRADVATGDQNTNAYRAFFGRRYAHGEVFQLSAEQMSTQPNNQLPSSDALNVMARAGTTRGPWSADAFAERSDGDRGPWTGLGRSIDNLDTVPGFQTRRTTAYLRLANGDPELGRWLQVVASSHAWRGAPSGSRSVLSGTTTTPGPTDTTSYENQYLLTGGITQWGARLSAAERLRVANHRTSHALSGRASWESRVLSISLLGEGQSALDPSRAEATVRLAPFDRVALVGSASRTGAGTFSRVFGDLRPTPVVLADGTLEKGSIDQFGGLYDSTRAARFQLPARTNLRAEAGIRLADLWISGGVIRRGPTVLLAPASLDSSYGRPEAVRAEGQATARTLSVRGRLYKALRADAWAIAWSDSMGLYRPKYQTRSELYIQTNLLDRFPRGNFGLLTSLAHEYRSTAFFASADSLRRVEGSRTLAFRIEVRINTAVISYQFRNVLQQRYQEVPGFFMPRQTQFYGVRWDFWN